MGLLSRLKALQIRPGFTVSPVHLQDLASCCTLAREVQAHLAHPVVGFHHKAFNDFDDWKLKNKLDPRCQNRSRVAKIVMWYFESIYSFLRKPRGPLWWSHSHLSKELGIDPQNLNSSLCNHREGPNHLLSQTHHAMQAVWPRSTRSSCTCNTRITFFHATINIAQNPKVM